MRKLLTLITLCFLSSTTLSLAKNIILFGENGRPHEDYDLIMRELRAKRFNLVKVGDTIQFSDGKKFKVKGVLGNGAASVVLDVGEGALKIPMTVRQSGNIKSFVDGFEALKKSNTKIVNIIRHGVDSAANEWVLVEKVDVKYDLENFLKKYRKAPNKAALEPIVKQLETFFESTWKWSDIGDIHAGQIVYDGKEWKLLDWTKAHRPVGNISNVTVVDHVGIPKDLQQRMTDKVLKRREAIRACMKRRTPSNALKSSQ